MRLAPFALVLALAAATAHGASVSHVSGAEDAAAAAALRRRLQDISAMPVNVGAMFTSGCSIGAILAEPVKPQLTAIGSHYFCAFVCWAVPSAALFVFWLARKN